jgi:UDP:flavonoid glycosyltransferase YjiC (YdhE family)
LVPLARAAAEAGHKVAFASARSFGPTVEQAGFTAFSAGFDSAGRQLEDFVPGLRDGLREDSTWYVVPHVFVGLWTRAMLPDLLALCRSWQPDLLVRENAEFAACLAGEMHDIPYATLRATASAPTSYANRHCLQAPLGALREYAALPPDPDVAMPFRHLYLLAEPPGFSQDEVPPTTHYLRPAETVADRRGPKPAWLAELPDRPTVHASLGTAPLGRLVGGRASLQMILEALRDEPINLIVTVGPNTNPDEFGPQPSNVRIERFIPHELLLPWCDLMLTHAGLGTIKATLSHGIPMVLLPLTADQPENAVRCAAMGVGVVVGGAERSAQAIRDAVRRVLSDRRYRDNARRVGTEIMNLPTPREVLPLLEQLVPCIRI